MATFGSKSTAAEVLADQDLSGKVIIVTGSNGGLGLEVTKSLANAGAHVMMTSRNVAAGEEALATIQSPEMKVTQNYLQLSATLCNSIHEITNQVICIPQCRAKSRFMLWTSLILQASNHLPTPSPK